MDTEGDETTFTNEEEKEETPKKTTLTSPNPRQRRLSVSEIQSKKYEIDYNDEPSEMTRARRLAQYLSKYKWYNPQAEKRLAYEQGGTLESSSSSSDSDDELESKYGRVVPPSLDHAWAYFEHSILPRYLSGGYINGDEGSNDSYGDNLLSPEESEEPQTDQNHDALRENTRDTFEQAEPGEQEMKTKLYPIWSTPTDQLADFGIGVGIYFFTLKIAAFICLVAGLINIPSITYFRSTDYVSDAQESAVFDMLKGSALCTDTEWMACPTCTKEDWNTFPETYERYASTTDNSLHFILVNNCQITNSGPGIASFCSLLFVTLSILILSLWVQKKEVQYDEAAQTTTDYSIEIENPPIDSRSVEEWKTFFENILPDECKNKHVTCCTVALDNEELMYHLVKRRQLLHSLENMTPPNIPFDKDNVEDIIHEIPSPPKWKKRLCLATEPHVLISKIKFHEEKIEELSEEKFDVSNVFITYETEEAQRMALERLSVSMIHVWRNGGLEEKYMFRGEYVLAVREPVEPDSVRWDDLDDSFSKKTCQLTITTTISLGLIALGGYIISLAREESAALAAIAITAINTVTPKICQLLVNKFEAHSSEGSKQASEYFKITLFRWTTTALISTIITPFTNTTANGRKYLLPGLRAIFITEMVKTPILQLLDIMGIVNRHILGPRAPDQRRMNLKFKGTLYTIGERYTDLTKVLFLTFFYAVIFPAGFFFAFVTLFITYWTDKFCLLRQWTPGPKVGDQISEMSRSYFFTAALVGFSIFGAYSWAGFPFDNACDTTELVSDDYVGTHNAFTGEGDAVTITLSPDNVEYYFCSQDMIRFRPVAFPALPSYQRDGEEWMTDEQETVVNIYGWTGIAILCVTGCVFLMRIFINGLVNIFCRKYQPQGEDMQLGFSEVREIFGYVPSIKVPGFPYPLLACDLNGIKDRGLIGWSDPHHPYKEHNLVYDVPKVRERLLAKESDPSETVQNTDDLDSRVFHIVKEWPFESNQRSARSVQ